MPKRRRKSTSADQVVLDFEGLESETIESDETSEPIVEPFDPTDIRVGTWSPTIQLLIDRIKEGEIDLGPAFQRSGNIWSTKAQSRLIESLLIRIPLPAFYFDGTDEDHLIVIDGQQRLTTLRRFILDQSLTLKGLEFLTDYEGYTFKDLPRLFQRRLLETQVTVFLIEGGTPDEVKYTIFKRINTTGLPLTSQEIRHALNPGPATEFLRELAASTEFKKATDNSIPASRMIDRECVLRFMAFTINDWRHYDTRDLDKFLHEAMAELNSYTDEERNELKRLFKKAMRAAYSIFGNDAFRKRYKLDAPRFPINKALYEAWSVNLAELADEDVLTLTEYKDDVIDAFTGLLNNDRLFEKSVSASTGDPKSVHKRFSSIQNLIEEVLYD